jgi:hypothetical protein
VFGVYQRGPLSRDRKSGEGDEMAGAKKAIERTFIVALAGVAIFFAIRAASSWWKDRKFQKDVLASCRAAVVEVDPAFPPGLLVEFENEGRIELSPTHVRLVFYHNDREISRLDKDLSIKPMEKGTIRLKSSVERGSTGSPPPPGFRVRYSLMIYPLNKKPLPEITGDLILKNP